MRCRAYVYPCSIWFEHVSDLVGDSGLVHPVKRLGEDHDSEASKTGWEVFRSHAVPLHVVEAQLLGFAAGGGEHVSIRIDPHDLIE